MEVNVILKILLDKNSGILIEMGEASDSVSPMTLVGILEQVKHSLFENMRVEKIAKSNNSYDA